MEVPQGDHDYDYYFVITVTNYALLETVFTYQVSLKMLKL